ncbi:hypothetical protein JTB14_022698 [Gonioctena quinquepunctata]|nr:hypothetical protein JTB14_022698 [Gonioctena quinquepunctata]
MGKIVNLNDFEVYFEDDYDTEEYDSKLFHTQYRIQKLEHIFRLFADTIQDDEYIPFLILENYEEEQKVGKRKLKKLYPEQWNKFEKMQKEYRNKYKIESKSKRKTLLDYLIKNNTGKNRQSQKKKKKEIKIHTPIEKTEEKEKTNEQQHLFPEVIQTNTSSSDSEEKTPKGPHTNSEENYTKAYPEKRKAIFGKITKYKRKPSRHKTGKILNPGTEKRTSVHKNQANPYQSSWRGSRPLETINKKN